MKQMIKRKKRRAQPTKVREAIEAEAIAAKGEAEEVLYCRVSDEDLKLENQQDEFFTAKPEKIGKVRVVFDIVEGDGDRENLYHLLDTMAPESTINIIAIDRVSRSLQDTLAMVEILKERKINMPSLRQGCDLRTMDRATLVMLGYIAEAEKKNISLRTIAGIKRVRKENMNNPERLDHWGGGLEKYRHKKMKSPGKQTNKIYLSALPKIKEMRRMGFTLKRIAEYMTEMHKFEFSIENVSRLINHGHG